MVNQHIDGYLAEQMTGPPKDMENLDEKYANGYIIFRRKMYEICNYRDENLLDNFAEDFEGWSADKFSCANKDLLKSFRDFLVERGIYLLKDRGKTAEKLADVLSWERLHEWTEQETIDILPKLDASKFVSRFNPILIDEKRHEIERTQLRRKRELEEAAGYYDDLDESSPDPVDSRRRTILERTQGAARSSYAPVENTRRRSVMEQPDVVAEASKRL